MPVASNQVCISLLDRRAAGEMSALCLERGVRLLAYGALGGGFLGERWLGAAEPAEVGDWSKMKYRRFIDAVGGWNALQAVLRAAQQIARKHGVSLSNVATRWVLQLPAVAAVIVGARLGESEHRADNLRIFDFELDAADLAQLDEAFAATRPIPGDCGDEYRRPPFLTASGDLSHHLASIPPVWTKQPVPGRPGRWRVDSGSVWEPLAGMRARSAWATASWCRAPPPRTGRASWSAPATRPCRPPTSWTRLPPASPHWAAACATWCARASTCRTSTTGRRWVVHGRYSATSGRQHPATSGGVGGAGLQGRDRGGSHRRHGRLKMEVKDQVIVVTGGGSGIGRALCERFAADGARAVVVADLNAEQAQAVATGIGSRAMARRINVGVEAEVQALVAEVTAQHGRVDLFCSNAGVIVRADEDAANADWQRH